MKTYPTAFCGGLYGFAILFAVMPILPPEAFLLFGDIPRIELSGAIILASIVFAIALIFHITLHFGFPTYYDQRLLRQVVIGTPLLMLSCLGASFVLAKCNVDVRSIRHVLDYAARYLLIGLVTLAVLCGVAIFAAIQLHPSNRMAKQMEKGDYTAAIRIGESIPKQRRDGMVTLNLALAYAYLGQCVDAECALLASSDARMPKYVDKASYEAVFKQTSSKIQALICESKQGA